MLKNLIRRLQRYVFAELFNELAAIRLELARRNEVLEGALLAIALENERQEVSKISSSEAA
ncbi:hypothetical protein [Acidocella sp.]|uniref:hypothetical protein n=1 Tax=Acidocella sp. TaxID=50710 RepID=UPI00260205E7|nr:hypothetical protein [Acidocella sp.]MDD2794473.1 hypothetical protein [Acidocella sp.]